MTEITGLRGPLEIVAASPCDVRLEQEISAAMDALGRVGQAVAERAVVIVARLMATELIERAAVYQGVSLEFDTRAIRRHARGRHHARQCQQHAEGQNHCKSCPISHRGLLSCAGYQRKIGIRRGAGRVPYGDVEAGCDSIGAFAGDRAAGRCQVRPGLLASSPCAGRDQRAETPRARAGDEPNFKKRTRALGLGRVPVGAGATRDGGDPLA